MLLSEIQRRLKGHRPRQDFGTMIVETEARLKGLVDPSFENRPGGHVSPGEFEATNEGIVV